MKIKKTSVCKNRVDMKIGVPFSLYVCLYKFLKMLRKSSVSKTLSFGLRIIFLQIFCKTTDVADQMV